MWAKGVPGERERWEDEKTEGGRYVIRWENEGWREKRERKERNKIVGRERERERETASDSQGSWREREREERRVLGLAVYSN